MYAHDALTLTPALKRAREGVCERECVMRAATATQN